MYTDAVKTPGVDSKGLPISTSWRHLPAELKIKIARLVTVPNNLPLRYPLYGGPLLPDLDTTLTGVDREIRELFAQIASEDYLHIDVLMCNCINGNRRFVELFEWFDESRRCRSTPGMFVLVTTLDLKLSIMKFEVMCDSKRCPKRVFRVGPFLATEETMLILYGVFQRHIRQEWLLKIQTVRLNEKTRKMVDMILEDMQKILYGITMADGSVLPAEYDMQNFSDDMGRLMRSRGHLGRTLEAHMMVVQRVLDGGAALEDVMPGAVEYHRIVVDDIKRLFLRSNTWSFIGDPLTEAKCYIYRLNSTYTWIAVQGVADYLLSRNLGFANQRHYLIKRDAALSTLQDALSEMDSILLESEAREMESQLTDEFPRPLWIVPMLKARAEFLLARARFNTEASMTRDGGWILWGKASGAVKDVLVMLNQDMMRIKRHVCAAIDSNNPDNLFEGYQRWDGIEMARWWRMMRDATASVRAAQVCRRSRDRESMYRLIGAPVTEKRHWRLHFLPGVEKMEELHEEFDAVDWAIQ